MGSRRGLFEDILQTDQAVRAGCGRLRWMQGGAPKRRGHDSQLRSWLSHHDAVAFEIGIASRDTVHPRQRLQPLRHVRTIPR